MSYGSNLQGILGTLHLSIKDAAKEMGLSYNTLQNVINEKGSPFDETKQKIENWVISKGYTVDELMQETPIIHNFRIRTLKELSGNEKSAVKKFLIELIKKIIRIKELEQEGLDTYEFFDLYTIYYKENPDFDASSRCSIFLQLFKIKYGRNNLSGKKLCKVISKIDEEDCDLLYRYSQGDIISLIETLGIRLFLQSFGSKKIESCSFGFDNCGDIYGVIYTEPSIIVNTDICKSYESARYIVAKELYKMLRGYVSKEKEYSTLNYTVKLESKEWNDEAIKFADAFLIPKDSFNDFLEPYKRNNIENSFRIYEYGFMQFIDEIKRRYNVGYELAIKNLIDNRFFEETEFSELNKKYLNEWKKFCQKYGQKQLMVDTEPNGRSLSYIGSDFFEKCVSIANQQH